MPRFVRPGTILPGQIPPARTKPGSYAKLVATCFPGGDGAYDLYEDDGITQDYLGGRHSTIPMEQRVNGRRQTITVGPAAVNGLSGLMRRLRIVSDYTKLVSPCWPYHKDERLAVWAAQTGNRISRNPATAQRELADLRGITKKLPKVLREFEKTFRDRKQSAQADFLIRAQRVLEITLASLNH